MGYETKLFVVEKHNSGIEREDGRKYGQVVAMFDLCKVHAVSAKFRTYPETDCYIYAYNCDGDCIDNYGEVLKEIPITDAIEILENAASNDDYRRYAPCISLLKGFNLEQWGNRLVVLHFGH